MIRPPAALLALAAALAACDRAPAVETQPRQLVPPPFEYPEELWDAGVEGKAVLRIRVDTTGRVDSVRVATASGHKGFDSSAVAGTAKLRFAPATRDGKPVARWVLLPVFFDIDPDSAAAARATARPAAQDTAGT